MRKACRTRIRLAVATIAVAALLPAFLTAQEDGDTPLGDVARTFRKKNPPAQEVIDNDNFSKVMDQVESHRSSAASLRYSVDAGGKSIQVSAPDVTCSLAFSANTKALLATQYVQVDLPAGELLKLDGPATIDGDALQVSVFNGTDWHVSEVAVALTLLKRTDIHDTVSDYGTAKLIPAVTGDTVQVPESRAEKRSDMTVIYRMRAAASPSATTVFAAECGNWSRPGVALGDRAGPGISSAVSGWADSSAARPGTVRSSSGAGNSRAAVGAYTRPKLFFGCWRH